MENDRSIQFLDFKPVLNTFPIQINERFIFSKNSNYVFAYGDNTRIHIISYFNYLVYVGEVVFPEVISEGPVTIKLLASHDMDENITTITFCNQEQSILVITSKHKFIYPISDCINKVFNDTGVKNTYPKAERVYCLDGIFSFFLIIIMLYYCRLHNLYNEQSVIY